MDKVNSPEEIMLAEMDSLWQDFSPTIHSELTIRRVWEQGFEAGYRSGIDRGMDIEHDAMLDLKALVAPVQYYD